ncbi:MAG: alpha-ribazole phosphatase family protein, partial [Ferrovum sp.]|nr:alpha-ribazole phosphatase family protein [Ferrovum sp.]
MNIWLIRHTTPEIETGICYGQSNIGVADTFAQEANMVRDKLPDLSGVTIYTSPLNRCRQLAEYLSQRAPLLDPRLMEMHFGDWEGQHWADIDQEALKHWGNNYIFEAPPNGESLEKLHARCGGFYDKVASGQDETVILVTHGGVIRSILC